MTNEKAIEVIQKNCYVSNLLNLDETVMINTALDRAVDALNKTSDKELIKQFKSIVRGDCIMLTKEAYSDLCLRAAGIIKEDGEPCEDCISRQHFDSRVRAAGGMVEEDLTDDFKDGVLAVLDMLRTEPSVKPTSQKWILTSECLPELKRDVLVFLKNGRFFVCALFPGSAGQKYWWIGEEEIHFLFDDVVAWRPLPEPYKEV